jgi:hypothetical protein
MPTPTFLERSFRVFRRAALAVAGAALVAGCSADRLAVPSFNEPAVGPADRALLQNLASGILGELRGGMPGLVSNTGIFGRESYNYTGSEPRNTSFFLAVFPLDNSGFTNGQWTPRYRNMRNAVNLITIADGAAFLSDAEKNAVRGFANTMRALDLFYVIATRDTLGAPVAIDAETNAPQPFVSRDSVYRFIGGLLDQAATQLTTAGATPFPFVLPAAGWSANGTFNTPATFRQFNRALAARVLVYRATLGCGTPCHTQALAALGESFITTSATTPAALRAGPLNIFSTASGDLTNGVSPLVNPDIVAHPSFRTDAQLRGDGTRDLRFTSKTATLAIPRNPPGVPGIPTDLTFTIYPAQDSPIPIIRNEELILLRAEANIGLGNLPTALTDLNFVRTNSGGLPALASLPDQNAAITALLYERRYSLMFEGHRWFDVRRYGRITSLPLDVPQHFRVTVMPVPQDECTFRALTGTPALRGPGCP